MLPREMTEEEVKITEQVLKTINGRRTLKEVTLEDSLRELQPWECDKKCLRSIFNLRQKPMIK